MTAPANKNEIPVPNPQFTADKRVAEHPDNSLVKRAKAWAPRGAAEELAATAARYAIRVIDRITGYAYTADELVSHKKSPVAAALVEAGSTFGVPISLTSDESSFGDPVHLLNISTSKIGAVPLRGVSTGSATLGAVIGYNSAVGGICFKADIQAGTGFQATASGADQKCFSFTTDGGEFTLKGDGSWTMGATVASNLRTALGIPDYADLAAANAALDVGDVYYDTGAGKLRVATA